MTDRRLAQIDAPHFCAALDLDDRAWIAIAPIIGYMRDWPEAKIIAYCKRKGWKYIQCDVQ